MQESKLDGQSLDIVAENVQKLKSLFPEIVTGDKIDFEKLQAVLGKYIDNDNERYNFTWHGKSKALRLAQTPSTGTLRPCKEESKDWDTTQNLYIEGDNLEVLKLLQKAYHNKIKMIYIDPPYNTGNDFVYQDDYKDNLENYLKITGQRGEDGGRISTNSETSGRYHTNWLNMMYPRLRLARNLLTDEGVIFISIDDKEVDNVKKICNEIFGEDNFIANAIWEKKFSPQNDAKWLSDNHDHVVIYAKNKEKWRPNKLPRGENTNSRYSNPDNDPRGPWASSDMTVKTYCPEYDYPIKTPNGRIIYPTKGRCWSMPKTKFMELIGDNRVWFGKTGDNVPRYKTFLSEVEEGVVPTTIWKHTDVGHNQEARQELKTLFDDLGLFDNPKPVRLLLHILLLGSNSNSIILDFFSGSATTAHAVMQLNAEDGGNRKFIMVQLPEPCGKDTEAYKVGYKNICEIGKERIRRAGEKIIENLECRMQNDKEKGKARQLSLAEDNAQFSILNSTLQTPDVGFKVFKLDSSNLKKWNPDYDNLETSLEEMISNYVDGRTELDVVYEIMLKYGIDLTLLVEECRIENVECRIYSIGMGALIICLSDNLSTDVAQEIIKLKQRLNPETMRVVFKDNGFKDDATKTNVKENLKQAGIEEFVTV